MTYKLPLRINETLSGVELIDAVGSIIAFAETRTWNGVPLEKRPEYVRENFKRLADAANCTTS